MLLAQQFQSRFKLFVEVRQVVNVSGQGMFCSQAATMPAQIQCVEVVSVVMPESSQFTVVEIVAPAVHAQHDSLRLAPETLPESSRAVPNQRCHRRAFGIGSEIQGLVLEIGPQRIFNPLPRAGGRHEVGPVAAFWDDEVLHILNTTHLKLSVSASSRENGSMRIYPLVFKHVFTKMDPEQAHHFAFNAIKIAQRAGLTKAARKFFAPAPKLNRTVMGIDFPSPFGLAAGFDKGATGILALSDIGFGHVEIGTVTGQAQPGNPQPRLFRLVDDRAVINRMGFNNEGAERVAARVAGARQELKSDYAGTRPVIGVNIGKTKVVELEDAVADYLSSTRQLAIHADYLVVNVSSPNTPGLRLLQSVDSLRPLLSEVGQLADKVAGRHIPLLVKIAPDLSDEDVADVARLAIELELDGIIATNTTIGRENLNSDAAKVEEIGAGGLSGAPLKQRSLEVLRQLRSLVPAEMALISVGGVENATDVKERLDAGADLVQGYTAFLYEGPFWARSINKDLERML